MRDKFIPLSSPSIGAEEIRAVSEVLKSGYLTTGPKVKDLEEAISRYIGKDIYAVGLNSCTGGLYLSLLAYGIGVGDEVIVPTWTFAATAHVVIWTGATPVLCDVDEKSLNIDTCKLRGLISKKTKCILPVHFAGYPCNMEELLKIARKFNLVIIDDAAHAIGTKYNGEKIGNFTDVAVFSFYATKNMTTGEGGMAVSKDQKIIEKIRRLSYFGINKEAFNRYSERGSWYYEIDQLGYKYNMDSIHAAIGLVQLQKLDRMNQRRREIAAIYKDNLVGAARFTEDNRCHYHTYHLFPIMIDKKVVSRDRFIQELKKKMIGASVHFLPLHKHPYYKKHLKNRTSFPAAEKAYQQILSIPMSPGMSDADVFYVIDCINDILKRRS